MDSARIIALLEDAYFGGHPDEEAVLRHLPGLLSRSRHFVDVGASLGQYTRWANAIMDGGRIDAIEADPLRFQTLRENCRKWAAESRNRIDARQFAISARGGEVTFFGTQSNVSGGLFQHSLDHLNEDTRANVHWEALKVPGATLDALYCDDTPDVVKMDIEGAEWDALQGAQDLVRRRRTTWLIELHDFGGARPEQVIRFMRGNGYGARELAPGRVLFRPRTPGIWLGELIERLIRRVRRRLH